MQLSLLYRVSEEYEGMWGGGIWMIDMCDGKLKLYSGVTETAVDWLWYPFIPYGKLTLLQGDPGCGKSTLMMNLIAAVSSGSC